MATTETCVCTSDSGATRTFLASPAVSRLASVDWARAADSAKEAGVLVAGKARDVAGDLRQTAVDRATDVRGSAADRTRDAADTATETAKAFRSWLRGPARKQAREQARRGAERVRGLDLAAMMPASAKDYVAEKTGRRRRRSRWATAGWVLAAMAGSAAGLAFLYKKVSAPGYDEESLWDSRVDERAEPLGGPHLYPAEGSGTGWPEPQRTPEHVEMMATANGVHAGPNGTTWPSQATATPAVPAVPAMPAMDVGPAVIPTDPAVAATPLAQNDGPSTLAAAYVAERGPLAADARPRRSAVRPAQADPDRTLDLPEALHASVRTMPFGGELAVHSEPAQRPETPFTQDQAENNARMQLRQEQLLVAFPAMTRHDIVASDGDLDALAGIVAPGAGMTHESARARIDVILGTAEDTISNPVMVSKEE